MFFFFVFEFMQSKNATNEWQFRSPDSESHYWINHKQRKVTSEYPYLNELRDRFSAHCSMVEHRQKTTKTKDLAVFREMMMAGSDGALIAMVTRIRTKLMKKFLGERTKYLEETYKYWKKKIERRVSMVKSKNNTDMVEFSHENEREERVFGGRKVEFESF